MSRENTWVNNDGIIVGFGSQDRINPEGAVVETRGRIYQIILEVDATQTYTGAVSSKHMAIPAYATIHSANFKAIESFDGAATSIGTRTEDGTSVDAAGLVAASVPAAGTNTVGAGSQIGTVGSDTDDLYLEVTSDATVGKGILTVEYILGKDL